MIIIDSLVATACCGGTRPGKVGVGGGVGGDLVDDIIEWF